MRKTVRKNRMVVKKRMCRVVSFRARMYEKEGETAQEREREHAKERVYVCEREYKREKLRERAIEKMPCGSMTWALNRTLHVQCVIREPGIYTLE